MRQKQFWSYFVSSCTHLSSRDKFGIHDLHSWP